MPYVIELIDRCGSPETAAEYAGIGTSTMYRIRHAYHETMLRSTAHAILDAVKRKRAEDRADGNGTHPRMVERARRVERMERGL